MTEAWLGPVAVLVPVKAFGEAKLRQAPALAGPERSRLARSMATHVLEAARTCGFGPHVVVASSDKAYGEQAQLPYTEDAPLQPRHRLLAHRTGEHGIKKGDAALFPRK